MADEPQQQTAIHQLAEAIGIVATGHRVAPNSTSHKNLEAAMIRFVAEKCLTGITGTSNTADTSEGIPDVVLESIRNEITRQRANLDMFTKAGQTYPGHVTIPICETLLAEVDRLRKRS